MKLSYSRCFLISCLLFALIQAGCHPSPRNLTLVSGKTVYGKMAMEDADIVVYRWEPSRWRYISDTRSGYHGSFRVHLPPGTYRFQASTTMRLQDEQISLSGTLENLVVKKAKGRMDQVVILMVPVSLQ